MKYLTRKVVAFFLLLTLLATVGCTEQTSNATTAVQVYMVALSNFNLSAMEDSITEGSNQDMGIDTSIYEVHNVQTDAYKKAVDSMYHALSETIEFEIHGTEDVGDGIMLVDTTLKCADVNQQAVAELVQSKVDEYIRKHPSYERKTETEKNDIAIRIIAEAYKEFVRIEPKVSEKIKIAVTETDNGWRVINGDRNYDLKQWIQGVFGTF